MYGIIFNNHVLIYGYFTCMFTATRIAAELDTGWFGSFSGNIYIC